MKDAMSTVVITAVFLLAFFSSVPSCAAEPKAEEVLAKLVKSYKSLKSFREEMSLTMMSGGKEMKQKSTLVFSRPNKVSWKIKGEDAEGAHEIIMCSDGKSLCKYDVLKKEYTRKSAPSSPSGLSSEGFGFESLILGLLDGDTKSLVNEESRLVYKGKSRDGLVVLSVVSGSGDTEEVNSYLVDPATFLLRGMKGDMTNDGKKVTVEVTLRYNGLGSPLNESLFRFTPPKGVREKGR